MTVQVEELSCAEGILGVLTLNAPESSNALSRVMVQDLSPVLERWAEDERIRLILIRASGKKAFCSGTHIRELQQGLESTDPMQLTVDQFGPEYRMLYLLHRFPKPVIGLAHSQILGSGVGLLQACRYRLITPDAFLALPEVNLGLFPGAGASWYLNRLPEGVGLFLGLTGGSLNASDALRIGLADLVMAPDPADRLIHSLCQQRWSGDVAADDNHLYQLLSQQEQSGIRQLPESELARHEQDIARLCTNDTLSQTTERLRNHQPPDSAWWQACLENMEKACPVSLCLVGQQLSKGRQLSLRNVLKLELDIVAECTRRSDLKTGIAHWLENRHQSAPPAWSYTRISEVPQDVILNHVESPWTAAEHPLAIL